MTHSAAGALPGEIPRGEQAGLPVRARHRRAAAEIAVHAGEGARRRCREGPRIRGRHAWRDRVVRNAAPACGARARRGRPAAGPGDQAAGTGSRQCIRRSGTTDEGRDWIRSILRCRRRRIAAGRWTEGTRADVRRHEEGRTDCGAAASHRQSSARCTADRKAHALGCRRAGVRPTGALGRHAARHGRRGLRDPRRAHRQAFSRASLSLACSAADCEPGEVCRGAAEGSRRSKRRRTARADPQRSAGARKGERRARSHRRCAARRSHGAGRMAGAVARAFRRAISAAAAGSADRGDAGSSALLPGARRAGQVAQRVHRRRQSAEPCTGQGPRRQRARGTAAARGRCILLEQRPSRAARSAPPDAEERDLPGEARLAVRQSRASGPPRGAHRRVAWRRCDACPSRCRAQQVRSAVADGRRVSGAAGTHGQVLRSARWRAGRCLRRAGGTVLAALCGRPGCRNALRNRTRARRQARHAGGNLRDRTEADGHARSLRAAPRGIGRAANDHGAGARARPAATDRNGSRGTAGGEEAGSRR